MATRKKLRHVSWLLALLSLIASVSAEEQASVLKPSTVFAQVGIGDQSTQAYLVGASWDWAWRRQIGIGTVTGYFEAAFGRWTTHNDGIRTTAWPSQISATPVLRLYGLGPDNRWFAEAGVGANYIVPIFRSGEKRFSTEFNFGDHVAVGRQFGDDRRQEVALRLEHFSNAGIDHPNPGENFAQVRYSYRF